MSAHHRTAAWGKTSKTMRARINAALPLPCVDCGRPVHPGQPFHVGHIIAASMGGTDSPSNLGPSHVKCNTKAGGKMGGKKTALKKSKKKREGGW